MAGTTPKPAAAVEEYLTGLRQVRASGGSTGEKSAYPALSNLFNAVGGSLKPKVFCVVELAEQGAGHPDVGLYAAKPTVAAINSPAAAAGKAVADRRRAAVRLLTAANQIVPSSVLRLSGSA